MKDEKNNEIWLMSSKYMRELFNLPNPSYILCLNNENSQKIDISREGLLENNTISFLSFFYDLDKCGINSYLRNDTSAIESIKSFTSPDDAQIFKHNSLNIFITKSFEYKNSKNERPREYWFFAYLETVCIYLMNKGRKLDSCNFNFIMHDKDFLPFKSGPFKFNDLKYIDEELQNRTLHTKSIINRISIIYGFQHSDLDYIFDGIVAKSDFFKDCFENKIEAHKKLIDTLNLAKRGFDFFERL